MLYWKNGEEFQAFLTKEWKKGILKAQELDSNILTAKKPTLLTHIADTSIPLTNATVLLLGCRESKLVKTDEMYVQGSDDASSSIENEHKETTSQGQIGFSYSLLTK